MLYEQEYSHSPVIRIDGTVFVPPHYKGETNIIVPQAIVDYSILRYGLNNPGVHTLDPMCGVGTIPWRIHVHGGECIGVEMERDRFEAARKIVSESHLLFGDMLTVQLPEHTFQWIFTSMPFVWFGGEAKQNPVYAQRFIELLASQGKVLLDSVPSAIRDGISRNVAELQAQYLEENGFYLEEVLSFDSDTPNHPPERSVIMKFALQ